MTVFVLTLLAAAAALGGSLIAIKNRDRVHLALGLTAGIILGLVAFDLLPEIFDISNETNLDITWPMIALVVGFLGFHIIEKFILLHHASEEKYVPHRHPQVGIASAIALCGHSFLDGASIGLAFQVNETLGAAIAVAVIAHRFADGFNTTNIMIYNRNIKEQVYLFLAIAVLAPIMGGLSTLFIEFNPVFLAIYLGFFAGFLLYISSADILPQAHSGKSSKATIALTMLGVLVMLLLSKLTFH